jgi:hypothetical protein
MSKYPKLIVIMLEFVTFTSGISAIKDTSFNKRERVPSMIDSVYEKQFLLLDSLDLCIHTHQTLPPLFLHNRGRSLLLPTTFLGSSSLTTHPHPQPSWQHLPSDHRTNGPSRVSYDYRNLSDAYHDSYSAAGPIVLQIAHYQFTTSTPCAGTVYFNTRVVVI